MSWCRREESPQLTVNQAINRIFSEYSDDFKYRGDLPLANWTYCLSAVGTYLVIIFALKKFMANREAFKLSGVVPLHNSILCIWSLAMLLGIIYELVRIYLSETQDKTLLYFCDPEHRLAKGKQVWWFYIFFLSKSYELLDTVIIVLKKRPIIFLHVYHHCITLILTFVMLEHETGVQWMAISANAAVHVPMYFYYALSSVGYSPWWKRYITQFQIIQFVCDLIANFIGFWFIFHDGRKCAGHPFSWIFGQSVLLSFLILFINFFVKTYSKRPTKKEN
ncbi:GNS1/SUR4 family protein [Planoprotostelium fungivorum]|uniref:Elongation of fatty acids protein n=1 Tax=Planoprotostelium fungivorum TaxID=1890364 RepID=A0A2P6NDU4_9EUKA|nr:GNS1/SUR4 family protein [Planoprotostelium fungivorum]